MVHSFACIGIFPILAILCTMYYDRFIKARESSAYELGVHSETYAGRY
jgi:membrane protein implicated in regulation of membrane protease activity